MILRRFSVALLALLSACQAERVATAVPATRTPQSPTPPNYATIQATDSPTPAPVPTATASPTPPPRIFTEEFDGLLPYWVVAQVDNGLPAEGPRLEAGWLVFDLPAPNQWVYAIYGGQEYSNVLLEVQAESRRGEGAMGLVCRYSETQGWYEFNVYADQTYALLLGQWLAPGIAHYTPLYRSQSEKIRRDANRLGLACEDNVLTPWINGVAMRRWEERRFGLGAGKIGLAGASFEDPPLLIAYDWVRVSEP